MLSNLVDGFLLEYLKRNPYLPNEKTKDYITTKSDLIKVLSETEILIRNNKDKSLEEIIDLIIADNIKEFEMVRKKYGVPGYTASIKVGNNSVKLYGGNINYLGEEMPANALFDIASMTKFYTQIIAYNLIREKVFNRDDRIVDLDNRFSNLGDLTINDILTFATTFQTDGLIKDKKTIDEALDTLYRVKVIETGKWNYNDVGLMIIKELMEKLTGLSYVELVNKYIVKPLGLSDTHIIVPKNKYHLITGTPNSLVAHVNDMTANAVGGYSGHAGIFASSDDIIKLMLAARDERFLPNGRDTYTPNKYRDSVGVMGNVYIAHPTGIYDSFVDTAEARDTIAISGSTRVNAASSSDSAYTVLFNPSSMDIEKAKERVKEINEERIRNGIKPIDPVREYEYSRDGKLVKYTLIDPRQLFPVDPMAKAVQSVAITTIKLRFLDYMIKKYDQSIKEIKVIKHGK